MSELQNNYTANIGDRKELKNNRVKYPVKIICEETGEVIVNTSYTVSKRQEKNLEKMIKSFTKRTAKEHEENKGIDHSKKHVSI
ncbi:MAG: hypothetical protein ABEI13_01730 [Candidatus Paceibacteria bacterium]